MKTATLVALVSSVLQVLMQVFFLCIDVFHFPVDDYHVLRLLSIASRCLLILFTGSIAYFFWMFHKRRMSPPAARLSSKS